MRSLILIILFMNALTASMLFDRANPLCIEDFYIKNSKIYYQRSDNLIWKNSSTNYQVQHIYPNYKFDNINNSCNPNLSLILGMEETDFNFLLGLTGLIVGSAIFIFATNAFSIVGGRR